jgi:hypothetical protein
MGKKKMKKFHPRGRWSHLRGHVKKKRFFISFYFILFYFPFCGRLNASTHPRGRTYALTFFPWGWKCKQGVDLACRRKHFFDQISNPQYLGK